MLVTISSLIAWVRTFNALFSVVHKWVNTLRHSANTSDIICNHTLHAITNIFHIRSKIYTFNHNTSLFQSALVPKISAYSWWNCQATNNRLQIEINYYPDSMLFISAGFQPRVSSQRLNWSYSWPQSCYEDDRTEHYSCSSRCRATYIRIQALLQSIPVPFVLATSPVEEWAINATDVLDGYTQNVPDS